MLLALIKIIISLILIYGSGQALSLLLARKINVNKSIGLALGWVLVVQLMFYMALLVTGFNFWLINLLLLIFIGGVFITKKVKLLQLCKNPKLDFTNKSWVYYLLVILIIWQVLFVVSEAALRPMYAYDSLANWGWRAKVISQEKELSLQAGSYNYLGQGHVNYPLFMPLSGAFIGLVDLKAVDYLSLFSALFFVLTLCFLWQHLKVIVKEKRALALVLISASAPLMVYHSFIYYADIVFAFYLLAAVVYFYNYLKTKDLIWWQWGSVLLGALVLIKNTGLFFSIIIWLNVFLFSYWQKIKFQLKQFWGLGLYLFLSVPWVVFKLMNNLGYSNDSQESFISFGHWHGEAIKYYLYHLILFSDFIIWPLVFIIIMLGFVIIKFKDFKDIKLFVVINTLLFLAAYLFLYLFTNSYNYLVDGTLDGRNLLTLFPLTVFTIGVIFSNQNR